jgi:uncharacterized protein
VSALCEDAAMAQLELETPHGPARAHLDGPGDARGALVLGHGAGGGVAAKDLLAAKALALSVGLAVALVEQPYRVAGRRAPTPARHLDTAWEAVVDGLRAQRLGALPLVVGGRSSGARVACRTSRATGAVGVLCLAFPLQPPQGKRPEPRPSRLPELDGVDVDVLVVQGEHDAFGVPPEGVHRQVCVVPGDHSLRRGLGAAGPHVAAWLDRIVTEAGA